MMLPPHGNGAAGQSISANGENGWEPPVHYLEWFRLWTVEAIGSAEIARRSNPPVTRAAVFKALRKTAEWIRLECFDTIIEHRVRQTEIHEKILEDAMHEWQKSRDDAPNTAFLTVTMNAMKAIRDIWGVDSPKRVNVEQDDGIRVVGMPHDEARRMLIERKITQLQALLASVSS